MAWGDRKQRRVSFSQGLAVTMMAIDGSWHRPCTIADISATGARLIVEGSLADLNLQQFFLLLVPGGRSVRRCELVRVHGDQLGVRFLVPEKGRRTLTSARA